LEGRELENGFVKNEGGELEGDKEHPENGGGKQRPSSLRIEPNEGIEGSVAAFDGCRTENRGEHFPSRAQSRSRQ